MVEKKNVWVFLGVAQTANLKPETEGTRAVSGERVGAVERERDELHVIFGMLNCGSVRVAKLWSTNTEPLCASSLHRSRVQIMKKWSKKMIPRC